MPTTTPELKPEVIDFSIKDFIILCFKKWYLFLLSLIVFLGLGWIYIYRQQPVYERSEEILITDQDSGGGVGEIAGAFSTLGLFSSNTSVNNELITLKSPAIMLEVAKRLKLYMNYSFKDGLKNKTLYGSDLPYEVEFCDLTSQQVGGMRINLNNNGSGNLSNFYLITSNGKEKFSDEISFKSLPNELSTPIGKIKITINQTYSGNNFDEISQIRVNKNALQSTVELYNEKLVGDLVDQDADVIGLSIRDVSVQRAVDILNTVLTVYNENWIDDKNKMSIATSQFIDARLKVIQEELGDVDSAIADYQTSTGTTDLVTSAYQSLIKENELETKIVELSTQLTITQYLSKFIQDKAHVNSIIPVNIGDTNQSLESQIINYNETLLSRNNLVANSSESNPLVENYDIKLKEMKEMIISGIKNSITSLETHLHSLQKEYAETQQKIGSTPTKALPLLTEERQQKVKESLYLFLLQKREENELTQTFTATNTRVITPPMGSLEPVAPRKMLIYSALFILGVAIPLIWIYFTESSNNKVLSRKDLDGLEIPFAGEIPQVGKSNLKKSLLAKKKVKIKDEKAPLAVVEEGKRDIVNEAFRVIRSNIDFMLPLKNSEAETIMLTSFNPGSGKSFISYNLGLSFALKNKKILLIDCDLRHGSSSMYVGFPNKGLTDYLTGANKDWNSLLKKPISTIPNLSILPIGKLPPNPAELLDNGAISQLIEEAKKDYDYIFLDCPPVNIVVDTQIIGKYANATLFVVRAGLLEKSALPELNEFYRERKFNHMSLILNGTDEAHSRYSTYGNYQHLE